MRLDPFRLERYYAEHEFTARYMLSSSDCESVAIGDLLALEPDAAEHFHALWLGYTETRGAPRLRREIAGLYQTARADEILVQSTGVLLAPRELYARPGHVRIGFGRKNMPEALQLLARFLDKWPYSQAQAGC